MPQSPDSRPSASYKTQPIQPHWLQSGLKCIGWGCCDVRAEQHQHDGEFSAQFSITSLLPFQMAHFGC